MTYQKCLFSVAIVAFSAIFAMAGIVFADFNSFLPTADGFYSQWSGTHYQAVDDATCDGKKTVNSTSIAGARDSYQINLSNIPDGSTITTIELFPCASAFSATGSNSTLKVFYRWDDQDSIDAGNYTFSSGTTPSNLSATTFSGLNLYKTSTSALESGVVLVSGTKGAKISRLLTKITYTLPEISLPAEPSNILATVNSGNVDITWTDNATNETGFVVLWNNTPEIDPWAVIELNPLPANTTSYTHTNPVHGAVNYYKIRAQNSAGYSESSIASIFVP